MDSVEKGPVREPLGDLGFSILFPFAMRAAVVLNVPKIIGSLGPGAAVSAREICDHLPNPESASSENLERILELLSYYGVLTREIEDTESRRIKRYGLTGLLQDFSVDEYPNSLIPIITSPEIVKVWAHMHEIVLRPEESLYENVYGKRLFQHLREDEPELGRLYFNTLAKQSAQDLGALLEHYDGEFRSLKGRFVDVGGNEGVVAAAVASRYPNIECAVNFDLPEVVCGAPVARGVAHVGGSFFENVPKGDLLLLKHILLNWDDEGAVKILRNCFNALPARGKAIIADIGLRNESNSLDSKVGRRQANENLMLAVLFKGGKSRTLAEFKTLAESAGFARLQYVKTVGTLNFLEAVKA